MTRWVFKGLRTGIKTTGYPAQEETTPGVSPGLPLGVQNVEDEARSVVSRCSTAAISQIDSQVSVDYRRCIHCFRCTRGTENPLPWPQGYEWAAVHDSTHKLGKAFGRSLHILVVDAGNCGACLSEAQQINNPYYNIHRLGFFITPTPRNADILMVMGPVTDHMKLPLQKTYEAMPTPKRVVAIGACALSGGIFGPSFACRTGVLEVIPVDIMVPGCPPPPLVIIHGLLLAVERKPSASLISPESSARRETT